MGTLGITSSDNERIVDDNCLNIKDYYNTKELLGPKRFARRGGYSHNSPVFRVGKAGIDILLLRAQGSTAV